jgi:hypothetical protein
MMQPFEGFSGVREWKIHAAARQKFQAACPRRKGAQPPNDADSGLKTRLFRRRRTRGRTTRFPGVTENRKTRMNILPRP